MARLKNKQSQIINMILRLNDQHNVVIVDDRYSGKDWQGYRPDKVVIHIGESQTSKYNIFENLLHAKSEKCPTCDGRIIIVDDVEK